MTLRATLESLRTRLRGLAAGGFVRSVAVLAGGTAFAQALGVLVLPILTRLYTPADFTILAVYASILGIVSVVACLRLEIAIPLPERDDEAANLLALALCSSAAFGLALGFAVLFFGPEIVALVKQPALGPYLYLVPIGTWLASSYNAVQYWATRKKAFAQIARTRVSQSVGGAAIQAGFGWGKLAPLGLLLGSVVNNGAGALGLGREAWRGDREALRAISPRRMWATLSLYDRFPKYSVLDALANNAGIQLPMILIAALAMGPEAGFLTLANRVIGAPMGLIGGAVSQVYLSRAPEELRAQSLAPFTARIVETLLRTGLGPLLFAGIVAPQAFALVFGPRWSRAGELVTWMTPWLALQFLSSPVSMVMHVTNRTKALLAVTLSAIPIRLGAIWAAYTFDINRLSEFYAISGGVFYFLCVVVFYRAAGLNVRAILSAGKRGLVPVLMWVAFGLIVRLALASVANRFFGGAA